MNLIRRLFPFRTCTIDIKEGERALDRPCLLYHIKRCQGPCIEAIDKAELPGGHRPGDAVPRGTPGTGRTCPAQGHGRSRPSTMRVRAGGRAARQGPRDRADDGEPEDGRLRPAPAGCRWASRVPAARPRSSCSPSAMARPSVATCSCSRTSATDRTTRRMSAFVQAVLRHGRHACRRGSCVPFQLAGCGRAGGAAACPPGRARSPFDVPAARRGTRAHGPSRPERRRDARP